MAKRLVGSQVLARELNVSGETIRYQARQGRIPFILTPGGHRRFDIDEVREALGMSETDANGGTETVREVGIVDGVVIDIDLTEPHREMREETSTFFSMSAARDERMLILDH